ncbi:DNase-NucA-NucB domain-containing protein [Pyrenophora tritici-repentis]|nr:DNase-NucA-NucB domain-containing protein [Pyrenophora tritici-repentis]
MTPDLSLPSRAPELGQYDDCNWDDAAFAVYTLLGDKVSVQDVASVLEKQWLDQGNEKHLVRPAEPTAKFETLQEIVQAHINLDKGRQPHSDAVFDLEWWPTAFIVVVREDWRTKTGGLLFVFADDENDCEMDKFYFNIEDAYMMLSSLSFGDEELSDSAFCQKWGESFTWDHPTKPVGRSRSRKAGCGSKNRCSKSPYGTAYQCDEFPFKSVQESDAGGQVNRCVKKGYNNAQSQVIRQFYNSEGSFKGKGCDSTFPCSFNIVFANAGNIDWCDSTASKCKNDGNEYTKAGKVPDPSKRLMHRQESYNGTLQVGGMYLLESGQSIVSAQPLSIGDRAFRVKRHNETLYAEYNHMHIPDD